VKIILDECIPQMLAPLVLGHEVTTVPKMGWAGVTNGKLLALIEKDFDVFVTVDRNLAFQQNTQSLKLRIFVLHAKSNRLDDLKQLIPEIEKALATAAQGGVLLLGS
jgi:hypothetical protein